MVRQNLIDNSSEMNQSDPNGHLRVSAVTLFAMPAPPTVSQSVLPILGSACTSGHWSRDICPWPYYGWLYYYCTLPILTLSNTLTETHGHMKY